MESTMKKYIFIVFVLFALFPLNNSSAEEAVTKAAAPDTEVTAEEAVAPAEEAAAPVEEAVTTVEEAPAPQKNAEVPAEEAAVAENLEFVSGEITALDEATKTITVKLYGENEAAASEKALSIKLDDTTDITDGEQDREFKSLAVGTEIDVEYDPASSKATYIFVY